MGPSPCWETSLQAGLSEVARVLGGVVFSSSSASTAALGV